MIATGGEDGAVRLWSAANRELLTQFTEHSKAVSGLCVDETQPHLLHSCGLDNSTVTMDIKKERRDGYHMMKGTVFHCIAQRKDSETELVTGNADGTIMFWDADESTPVIVWQHPSKERIRAVEVSPSGRYLVSAGDDQNITVWGACAPLAAPLLPAARADRRRLFVRRRYPGRHADRVGRVPLLSREQRAVESGREAAGLRGRGLQRLRVELLRS